MNHDTCPINHCDLRGEPIKQEYIDAGYYGEGVTHYSRMVGVDGGYLGIYDGVIAWHCPDCGAYWPRFTDPHDRRYHATMDLIPAWENDWKNDHAI